MGTSPVFAILALVCLVLAGLLFWRSGRRRKAAGLPGGRVIYADTRSWGKLEEPLYDPLLGLTGKPDYLVESRGYTIPVEVKSSRAPHTAYDSHIFQLAGYCLLVWQVYGSRPPYGILHYSSPSQASRTFAIDFTVELEESVRSLLEEMRLQGESEAVDRSHKSRGRCISCGFRSICDQALE